MRDRTASRKYSASNEEFRRDHKRRRDWGLIQRHELKLRRLAAERANPQTPAQREAAAHYAQTEANARVALARHAANLEAAAQKKAAAAHKKPPA